MKNRKPKPQCPHLKPGEVAVYTYDDCGRLKGVAVTSEG